MLYRQVQNTHLCIFGRIHVKTVTDTVYVKVWWLKGWWEWVQPWGIALRWKKSVLTLQVPRSHYRQVSGKASMGLWSSWKVCLPLGKWSKAVLWAAFTHGLGVHRGQRIYLQGSCCCWSLDRASLRAPQPLGGCVCLCYTSSPIPVVPQALGCSQSRFPCSI